MAGMYFITRGTLDYKLQHAAPLVFGPGCWLCEGALWLKWEHRGRLLCSEHICEYVELDASEFRRSARESVLFSQLQAYAQWYAREFLAVVGQDIDKAWTLTDLRNANELDGVQMLVEEMVEHAF